jgi:hypothetical protein
MVKASDLVDTQKSRDKNREKIYKQIYKKVEQKIMFASSMNLYECWYELPEFIFNIPLYNMESCKQYIKNRLKTDGFLVYFVFNKIVISWKNT